MIFKQDFLPENAPTDSLKYFKNGLAESITIHWTGENYRQSPEVVRNYWLESGGNVSTHFIIKDEKCLQCVPITKICYHTGVLVGNNTSIGIEVIAQNGKGEFSDMSIKTLRELLSILPQLPIFRHYDWSGKDCPRYYTDKSLWEQLKKQITPYF